MELSFKIEDHQYSIDSNFYHDISIPLQFNGEQPNTYDVEEAKSQAYEKDGFIGDTRKGGGCNFEKISIITHCNGTHTECVGHLTHERYAIHKQLKDTLIPATLISVTPVAAVDHMDGYDPPKENMDEFISRQMLEDAMEKQIKGFNKAMIIRTIPNDKSKLKRRYMEKEPPYFSLEAMEFIVNNGVDHLLVDIPSVDRTFDEGRLNTHHIYWNIQAGSHETTEASHLNKTITEMIYVPDEVLDGHYLLNLQIAPFVADASPSRPILFPMKEAITR